VKHKAITTLTVLMALALSACGGGGSSEPPATTVGGGGGGSGTVLEVKASEFKFDPSTLTAAAGEDLTIKLVNVGVVEHDLTIDDLGVALTVKVGETGEASATNVPAGTYEVYCAIAGHKEAGMVGTLEVK
jgi:plastocyanin